MDQAEGKLPVTAGLLLRSRAWSEVRADQALGRALAMPGWEETLR